MLWWKASEKIHDCKLKPDKFQLEMKSNFNQEDDHHYHPMASLKKNTGYSLQRPFNVIYLH